MSEMSGQHPLLLPEQWQPYREKAEQLFADYMMGNGGFFEWRGHPELFPWLEAQRELRSEVDATADHLSQIYVPGMELEPDAEPMRERLEAEYWKKVREQAHKLAVTADAKRKLGADGWLAPGATADLAAELELPRQTAQHRIPGLAGWNHNVLIQGPRKTGKTTLEINLASSLSLSSACTVPETGQVAWTPGAFLGLSQCWMSGNVACINAEMDADDWRDEFRRRPVGSYDGRRIFPLHRRGERLPVITNESAREWFVDWLRERSVEVLFIDTWGVFCAHNGMRNLNDDAEVRVVLDGLDQIKAAAGVASVYVLIHTPHQVPGMKHLERFKGAGAVGDWADALWSYVADAVEDGGTRYLSAVGRARIDAPESSLAFDPATGLLSWGLTGSRAQTSAERQRQAMLAALAQAGGEGLITTELMEAAGGHTDTARKTARAMAGRGELVTETKGKAVRWWIPGSEPAAVQGS